MILFLDTETTGIPRNYRAPVSDLDNWPRLVQLGWLMAGEDGAEISAAEFIVRPEGFVIPDDAARVHGISNALALQEGVPLATVLEAVVAEVEQASVLVAHNMQFDEKILGAELLRTGYPNLLDEKLRLCTMQSATDYCRLPGRYGFKWPTLQELHHKLFGESFAGGHSALADVRACARCFFRLKQLQVLA